MRGDKSIDFRKDIIDSRDIKDRISYLEISEPEDLSDWEKEELDILHDVEEDFDFRYWKDGITFINDNYFTEYTEEYVKDVGDMPQNLPSILYNNIDWDGVAEDLQQDYSSIDIDSETFWYSQY
jgi:hypothetical protein